MIELGRKVENYNFKDHNDDEIKLDQLKGKKVLLSFHPLAFTSVCANQMKALDEEYEKFEDLNTKVLGISVDALPSKKAWAEELEVKNISLVSDFWPHGEFSQQVDIFNEEHGFSKRANIILDEEGKVIFAKEYEISEIPNVDELLTAIKANNN